MYSKTDGTNGNRGFGYIPQLTLSCVLDVGDGLARAPVLRDTGHRAGNKTLGRHTGQLIGGVICEATSLGWAKHL